MAVSGGYEATYTDTVDRTNYSFATSDIGTAAPDRYVAVAIDFGATNASPASVTVGGITCSKAVEEATGDFVSIWITDNVVAAGTTATIAVNGGAAGGWCGINVYAYYGIDPTVVDTATSSGADPAVLSLNTLADGCAVAIVHSFLNPGPTTVTWTGLTENFDAAVDGNNGMHAASALTATGETPRTVEADFASASATNRRGVAVSFGPSTPAVATAASLMIGI